MTTLHQLRTPPRTYPPRVAPWAAGRFYDSLLNTGSFSTNNPGGSITAVPFWVPSSITIATIGVEVAGGGTTPVGYLALYTDRGDGYPDILLIDAGSFSETPAGFYTRPVNLLLAPGIYWGAHTQTGAPGTATLRTNAGSAAGGTYAKWRHGGKKVAPTNAYYGIQIGNYNGEVAAQGWPARFWRTTFTSANGGGETNGDLTRILLGT